MPDLRLAWALVVLVVRYLTTIRGEARREIARWRDRAHRIPDAELRGRVLRPFESDLSVEGAAVFAVLQPSRRHDLVPLLIAYVLLWSHVDALAEQNHDTAALHALVDAVSPSRPQQADASTLDDAGYLCDLITTCRTRCAALPSWRAVEPAAVALARHGRAVQAANHDRTDTTAVGLRAWAASEFPRSDVRWFELCAAASGPLAVHALLAGAADPLLTERDVSATVAAYFPAISAVSVLSDHFIDAEHDVAGGDHSFLRYYDGPRDLAAGLGGLAASGARRLRDVRDGRRHTAILAAMIAMFYSDPVAWRSANAATSRTVLDALGWSARSLLVILVVLRRIDDRPRRGS